MGCSGSSASTAQETTRHPPDPQHEAKAPLAKSAEPAGAALRGSFGRVTDANGFVMPGDAELPAQPPAAPLPVFNGVSWPPSPTAPGDDADATKGPRGGLEEVQQNAATPEPMEAQLRADLNGAYVLERVEGDMDALMKELGLSWAIRTAAKAAGYGAGKIQHAIRQQGDEIEIAVHARRSSVQKFTVGAGKQSTLSPEGQAVVVDPTWVDNRQVLYIEALKEDGLVPLPRAKRSVNADYMFLEITSPQGAEVKQIFKRL